MSARSLGVLTLDLVAKIGGFTEGLDKAARTADKRSREIAASQKRMRQQVEKEWSELGTIIAGGIAGITIAGLFTKFIQESRDAQNEQAQLAAVLKSTGEAAGFSQEKLNDMAAALASSTIFSEGEINKAQTRLLSYTNVVGEEFPKALEALLNMSARTGVGVEQAAETIGKALNIPSEGMASLSKQGFQFTEDQKKLAERLQATGKTAEAQGIILKELTSTYGGAAEAARNTFGGAITGLQNQLNSLMTGSDGSLQGATEAINELARTLGSAEVKQAFDSLTTLLANVISLLARGSAEFVRFGKFVGESIAKAVNGSEDPIERLDERVSGLRTELKGLDQELARPRNFSAGAGYDSTDEMKARAAALRAEIQASEKQRKDLVQLELGMGPAAPVKGPKPPKPPTIADPNAGKAAAEALKIALNAELKQWDRFLSEQQDLLQERNKFLELYNSQGLLSIKDYFDQQQNILDEATQAQVKAYDAQIKALQDYIAKTPKDSDRASSQEKLNDLLAKQAKLERDAGSAALEAGIKRDLATKEMTKAVEELNARLLELQGNLGAAAAIRFDQQNEALGRMLDVNGQAGAKAQLARIRELTIAQADLNKLQVDAGLVTGKLRLEEERVALNRQLGTKGEIESLVALGAARQQSYEQLKSIADEYQRVAEASGDPRMLLAAEQLRLELDQLGATLDPLADKFNTLIGDELGDAFADFVTGTKTAKQAFTDFANAVISDITRMIAKDLAKSLFSSASDSSGFNIGSWLSGLFGGGKANGGPVQGNTLYRVNERGPEMFEAANGSQYMLPDTNGRVIPNHKLGSGGFVQNLTFNVAGQMDRRTVDQTASETRRRIQSSGRLA